MFTNKRHFLWYPVILLIPHIHELGHYAIASLLHQQIAYLEWNRIGIYEMSQFQQLVHNIWEFSVFIPLITILCWAFLEMKDIKKYRKEYSGDSG